ncbi:hypothetical protein GCM10007276_12040 [Agaricicola taiwanensis]|uniref:Uncharacterized protein n=1 Tax=Agaricicola taiwanensis TaxID=591372 RepID=A0A8J2VLD7_9RHOB|nr:hypothetical protein [Agaricicola taiwanensis]GGE36172.1 hypothetical protein GCM10007276_12040 [Agaricicola taiwanensis]
MGFVASYGPGDKVKFERANNGREYVTRVAIGFDDDVLSTVSVVSALSILGGGNYEFVFWIAEATDGVDRSHWNGAQTKLLLPDREARNLALFAACGSVEVLLQDAKPDVIYQNTHGSYMPVTALVKHEMLNDQFRKNGYVVDAPTERHGRLSWRMERVT